MSKILSLDSIKTCLQKLKEYVDTKATTLKTDIDGRVPKTQVATQNGGPGIVSIKDLSGIKVTNGALSIDEATAEEVQQQTNHYSPITPGRLPDVFKTYGIENEQEVPILKQTIGYESRNLFDFDSWYASIKRIQGTGSSFSKSDNGITITSGQSTDAYTMPYGSPEVDGNALPFYIKVQPNTKYILSFTATGQSFNVYVFFFTDTGIHYSSNTTGYTTETASFTTPEDAKYISVRVAVKKENTTITFSNFQLQLANAQTDDTYQPYAPTVNDRLSVLEGLIKKKTFNNVTSSNKGIYDVHMTGGIPLSVSCSSSLSGASIRCSCWVSFGGNIYINFFNDEHALIKDQSIGDVTLYYIDLTSLTIQDTTEPAQAVQSSEELPSFEHLEEEPSYE